MKKDKQGFDIIGVIIFIIVIFIIMIVLAGIISMSKKSSSSNLPNEVVANNSPASNNNVSLWSEYTNNQFNLSFEYPSGWVTTATVTKTIKNNNWLLVAIKEKQDRKGMGTSWINVHVITTTDITDIPTYGQKTGEITVSGKKAIVWENKSTNQKYIVIPTTTSIYVIQSRNVYDSADRDIEQVYNHLLSSIKMEN
jgi:hypothetical protein